MEMPVAGVFKLIKRTFKNDENRQLGSSSTEHKKVPEEGAPPNILLFNSVSLLLLC